MSHEGLLLTPAGRITIERAQPSDLDTVLDILEEAAGWLISRGIDQWQPGLFRKVRRQSIADQLSRGEVYLAKRDGQAVGTLTLQWVDKMFWAKPPGNSQGLCGYGARTSTPSMDRRESSFCGKGLPTA